MRRIEWTLGLLSGLLGLAALALTLTQQTITVQSDVGTTLYGVGIYKVTTASLLLSTGVTVIPALLVALSAWQDVRRQARGQARGGWRWLAPVGAALSVAGVYLLVLNNLWVTFGSSGPIY
ncbi:MAG: hypothetical protein ACHQ1E_04600 [Ktedonobacterales bacterium]